MNIRAVEKAGYSELAEGAKIIYELTPGRSGQASAEISDLDNLAN